MGYQLLSRLGRGGMADVFCARPDAGGSLVAVKVLRPDGSTQGFRREFELNAAVDPDVTAAPITYGWADAGPYLVTSYLPGYRSGTAALCPASPISELWEFGAALTGTLAAVHHRGIVHCDVKPANLLVCGTDVRLIDFGISRYVGEPGGDDGIVQCSRGWASPEQLHNKAATPAIDVFAWGCVLAFAAAGVHPFASGDDREWILRIETSLPDLAELPAGMEDLIRAALAHDPGDRPLARELTTLCHQRAERSRLTETMFMSTSHRGLTH